MVFPSDSHIEASSIDDAMAIMRRDRQRSELKIKLTEPGKWPQELRVHYDGNNSWQGVMGTTVFIPSNKLERMSEQEIFDDIKTQIKCRLRSLVTEKTTVRVGYSQVVDEKKKRLVDELNSEFVWLPSNPKTGFPGGPEWRADQQKKLIHAQETTRTYMREAVLNELSMLPPNPTMGFPGGFRYIASHDSFEHVAKKLRTTD